MEKLKRPGPKATPGQAQLLLAELVGWLLEKRASLDNNNGRIFLEASDGSHVSFVCTSPEGVHDVEEGDSEGVKDEQDT